MTPSIPGKGSILIVDDTPQNLAVLTQMLTGQGYLVRAAINGQVAFITIQNGLPDLILLDIKMPEMDGYEVCRRLKADDGTREIPVIFLSVLDETLDKIKAFEVGGVDYITKPFQAEEVLARVETHLTLRKTQEELRKHRDHLGELVKERTAELSTANAQLHQEILERRRAEETLLKERNLLRTLIDNMPDYIYVKDRESRFLLANTTVMTAFGITVPDELPGKTDLELLPREFAEQFYHNEQEILRSGHSLINQEEFTHDTQSGEPIWLLTTKVPFQDSRGKIAGLVGISRDITTLKQVQHDLQALNEELEERVQERTTALQEANEALQHSLETLQMTQNHLIEAEKMAALGTLVAGVAHEINTPVGIGVTAASHLEQKTRQMRGWYEKGIMKRSDLERYLDTATESTNMILQNLRRAAEQIQSFKQVAVDQVSSEERHFNLKTYIDDLLISLHPKLKKTRHTVTVQCPEDLEILSYPGAFSQILTNFIVNSLTHGFEDIERGEMMLEITREGDRLRLCYRDNGRGMTPEERSRVFEPFYTTRRGQGSTGLGLYIVYNLVTQKLGGSIECESTTETGTTFVIQIPMGKDAKNPC